MTVHEPCARVIRFEGKHKITSSRECSSVAANGIVSLEAREIAIPDCVFLVVEHVEVVAVKMDGVGQRRTGLAVLLNYPILPL
jgi:hypothetical protein